jgi:hypothetical protein
VPYVRSCVRMAAQRMRYWIILLLCLCNCGGDLIFTPNGHRLLYKSRDGQLSVYTNNICYPYKEKVMLCTQASVNAVGDESGSVVIRVVPEN